eukprot:scaffold43851_cov40-Cyclotella_meneghiniana.AAC.5
MKLITIVYISLHSNGNSYCQNEYNIITSSPTTNPVTPSPSVAPVTSSPTTAPVTPPPSVAPITSSPTTAPVTPSPSVAPVTSSPTKALIGESWTQVGQDINGEAADDESGRSVSLSADGTVLAIGAPYNDGNGSKSGHVRVFKLVNDSWIQVGQDIEGEAAGDESGRSVSLSSDGTVLAIGATYNDGNGVSSGHVRVFQLVNDNWTQVGQDINGEAAYDYSGFSVSLSGDGNVLAIGAYGNDGNGFSSGHVRIFKLLVNDSWIQVGQDIDGEAAYNDSGFSVTLSADGYVLAIGAPTNGGNGSWSGHVRVFDSWTQTQIGEDINGEAAGDYSGCSVSLSSDGTVLAIGAPYNDGNGSSSGHVRVFKLDNNSWTQVGGDIEGEAAGDESGRSVSLSSDGTVLAIGAPYNGGNGGYSGHGHVRVFKLVNDSWTQVGQDIDGEAAYDKSGWSVSLSGDGTVLAIGAPHGNGSSSGHIRVYSSLVTTTPTAAPVTSSPSVAPVTSAPTTAPSSPTAAPVTPSPSAAPVTSSPTAAPVTLSPSAAPVTSSPTAAPVTPSPSATPVTSSPTAAPVTPSPSVAPVTSSPTGAPVKLCPLKVSKVKVQSLSGLPIEMREVRVFSSGVNVAIGKNATQSSDLNDSSDASKAVDGKWRSWSSTGTDTGSAWWELDLGEPLPVEKVIIVNRKCNDNVSCSCKLSHAAMVLFDDQGNVVQAKNLQDTCVKGWIVRNFPASAANCV